MILYDLKGAYGAFLFGHGDTKTRGKHFIDKNLRNSAPPWLKQRLSAFK
jgi:hypothetical protein